MKSPLLRLRKEKQKPVRKRDLGLAGLLTVLVQAGVGFHSGNNVNTEVEKIKEQFSEIRVEREQYFVRKSELENLSKKLDQVNSQVGKIGAKVNSIKDYLKYQYDYSVLDGHQGTIKKGNYYLPNNKFYRER